MKLFTMMGSGVAVALLASNVLAQEVNAQASAGGGGVTLPGAQAVPADSDHSQMVGRFGVGYMGRQTMVVGLDREPVVAPVIGMRYWLDNMIGLDLGAGFNFSSGSVDMAGNSADKPGVTVVMIHGGLPLNLADAGHFSFQVVPEATLGFAGVGDTDPDPVTELTHSGFLLSLGARAGAEIHFGFMGIPQLSLQGSVGLYLRYTSGSTETSGPGGSVSASNSSMTIGTVLGNNPWDIFTSSIAALYYF